MRSQNSPIAALLVSAFICSGALCVSWGAEAVDQEQIIDGMIHEQATRFEHFEGYTRIQHYSVTTARFGLKAELVARIHRDRIKGKTYEVISRSGSPVIQSHVFDALLEAEMDTSKQGGELLTRENYSFHLTGQQEFAGRQCYLIETEPKRRDKRLLKGRLWLDVEDFGLVHVEGKPSDSLSFWVGRPMIVQDFVKESGYWWASRRHSYIDNIWLGKSDLVIDYSDYQFEMRQAEGVPAEGVR